MAGQEITTTTSGIGYLVRDGNKLFAAGKTGADTTEAVEKLIEIIKS